MMYRCRRHQFSEADYQTNGPLFYALPTAWGTSGDSPLATVWRTGGEGAIAILPILGLRSHASFADNFRQSKEELARLGGVSVDSVRRGAEALEKAGLVVSNVQKAGRKPVTIWTLIPTITVPQAANGRMPTAHYFHFSARLVYGANWAQLTGVQRALYLALATSARAYKDYQALQAFLRSAVKPGVSVCDITAAYHHDPEASTACSPERRRRWACGAHLTGGRRSGGSRP